MQEIIAKFRVKGATSPDRAMTIEELGLPPRFEEAMHRRLGASGIIVEVNGRYYLDEVKLQQVQEQRRTMGGGGGWSHRGSMLAIVIVRRVVGLAAVLLVIVNILVLRSLDVSLLVVALLSLWVVLTLYQIYRFSRMRRRWAPGMGAPASPEAPATPS